MNIGSYIAIVAQLGINHNAQFQTTIGSAHFNISIVDKGTGAKPTSFNLGAAIALASEIVFGQPGTVDVRIGSDVYELTIAAVVPPTLTTGVVQISGVSATSAAPISTSPAETSASQAETASATASS